MRPSEFSLFRHDPALRSLDALNMDSLRDELGEVILDEQLDASLRDYRVSNVRYAPGRKLVLGLTAPGSAMPIGIRIFPREQLVMRLDKALDSGAGYVHCLPRASALAWIFPSERKLDLRPVADRGALRKLVLTHRHLHVQGVELVHFVPERSYTLRLDGIPAAEHAPSATRSASSHPGEYLKISYDDSGELASARARALAAQCVGLPICVPADSCYLRRHRLMFQTSLDRVEGSRLPTARVAAALACLHGLQLPSRLCAQPEPPVPERVTRARNLLVVVFPLLVPRFDGLARRILAADSIDRGPDVLLHGDAHPGNLLNLHDDRVGVIDLDRVHRAPASVDLASFYAFRLWKDLRDGHAPDALLDGYALFVDAYNRHALRSVALRTALHSLALHLCTERIIRGIARGKVHGDAEILSFFDAAERSLQRIGH